jgi:hypothetical protein
LSSNGIEYGVYNWNSTTGSFRVVGAVIDTTGECGFVSDSGGAPFEGTLTRNGNSVMVTFTDDDGNPATFTLMAGPNTTGQLFGTYGLPNGRIYILLGDGTYITTLPQARMTGAPANNYAIGFEHGCFTSTPTTITYNFTNTCVLPAGKLPIDLNGGWPFKSSASLTATGPYALSGDSLVLYAGTQFAYTVTRVIGN